MKLRLFILLGMGLWAPQLLAQESVRQAFDAYNRQAVQEKLYVHTDRSYYVVGESVWFKVYALNGQTHQSMDLSKVAYVELLDLSHGVVLQSKVSLKKGSGNGMLVLPATIQSGHYTLRAYTHWMKNFSPELYFEKTISIVNTFTKIPAEAGTSELDLQFFPEGGHLVQNLKSTVAFRGINESGKGVHFSGALVNERNDTIVRFQPRQMGMGTFEFTPKAGESYHAVLTYAGKNEQSVSLPAVQEKGYVLHVQHSQNQDLTLEVESSGMEESVYALVHTRQSVKFSERQRLQNGKARFQVPLAQLDEGISHITLFNAQQQPVCERLYFKRPKQKLAIQVQTDKPVYATRQAVSLALQAADSSDLSVSVYRLDSLDQGESEDVYSYLWLSSDLKGTVESPAYYVNNPAAETDLVMLTHGWSRFRWETIVQGPQMKYVPEHEEHIVFGKVTDMNRNPVKGAAVFMNAPGRDLWLYPAISDSAGRVFFEMRHFSGLNEVVVQPADSLHQVELESSFSDQYSSRSLPGFAFNPKEQESLLNRSIDMQVRNAYMPLYTNAVASDTAYFYGKADRTYYLDAYTRFPVLEEVMREYVPEVDVRRSQGRFRFLMVGRTEYNFTTPPMVLLDGVPMFELNKLLAIDPLKIKRLDIVNKRYVLGSAVFSGIVSFMSYKGDIAGYQPEGLVTSYEGVQAGRDFYSPRYDTPAQRESRIADFRSLLFWEPQAHGQQKLQFFTSDLSGHYRVVVQGISQSGLSGSQTYTFEVKKNEVN
ncbi:hypothetical protein [Siphonobacter sp. SORGH_AS_1065]|uniref:hypothetical protein n=1 Tax=Siphonobacter sp. SORGH_AS_1065 TaxID=3041795 RepID=UPI00278452A9|nr:hypothetical protein [Siphonobacter sp. SORGH_AS_1065]MDQ1085778.1 hypothetical protein [Siphonobacter sp. SORGH_AS_1065]